MISKMFGAPGGAETSLGKSGMESLTVRPIFPLNGSGGWGRTSCAAAGKVATSSTAANTLTVLWRGFMVFSLLVHQCNQPDTFAFCNRSVMICQALADRKGGGRRRGFVASVHMRGIPLCFSTDREVVGGRHDRLQG